MIKIPAAQEGIPAIKKMISEGVNINVTLIFSPKVYEQVVDAYMSGLEERLAAGEKIDAIASVASFFISRIDSMVI
jgi:transaldolase